MRRTLCFIANGGPAALLGALPAARKARPAVRRTCDAIAAQSEALASCVKPPVYL